MSVYLGPEQLFPSKQQIAHIAETRVSRRSLRIGAEAWRVGSHGSRKILPRTPEPAPQPTVLSRFLLHEFMCAHWFLPGSPLAKFDLLSPGVAGAESVIWVQAIFLRQQTRAFRHPAAASIPTSPHCSPFAVADRCSSAAFRLGNQQQQSFNVGASQTLGSGCSGAEHGACSFRPLSGRPAWPNATSSSRPLQSFPIPARQRPLVGLGRQLPSTSFRQRSRQSGALQRDCRSSRHRDGYQAQWCECLPKQSTIRPTPIPRHHFTVPHHVPDHLTF